jgi:hypothetical protein
MLKKQENSVVAFAECGSNAISCIKIFIKKFFDGIMQLEENLSFFVLCTSLILHFIAIMTSDDDDDLDDHNLHFIDYIMVSAYFLYFKLLLNKFL